MNWIRRVLKIGCRFATPSEAGNSPCIPGSSNSRRIRFCQRFILSHRCNKRCTYLPFPSHFRIDTYNLQTTEQQHIAAMQRLYLFSDRRSLEHAASLIPPTQVNQTLLLSADWRFSASMLIQNDLRRCMARCRSAEFSSLHGTKRMLSLQTKFEQTPQTPHVRIENAETLDADRMRQ